MSGHCDINIEPSQLICTANQLTGIYLGVAMAWYVLTLFEAPEIDLNKIYCNYGRHILVQIRDKSVAAFTW